MMKMEIWQKRYPDIGFFLSFFPYKKRKLSRNAQPLEKWLEMQNLAEVEVLYIIGLIGFALPKILQNWLSEKKQRALIFVEEDLGAFASFTDEKMLQNPQIHFHLAGEDSINSLAEMFPIDRLAIFEGKPFDAVLLKRKVASLSALYSDVLYSHAIVENVLTNFERLPGCFDARGIQKKLETQSLTYLPRRINIEANLWRLALCSSPDSSASQSTKSCLLYLSSWGDKSTIGFENIPAVICGAGPSLFKTIPALQKASEQALIFAGGSAITALTKFGVQPHFAMALDPNQEEFDRLRQANYFEGPFLFAPRLHRDVFCVTSGPFGYLKSDTGGLIEQFFEKELGIGGEPIGPDLGPEAFSVTTLAVAYAFAMGCNPILFAGVDLAFTGGMRYASGVEAKDVKADDPRALEEQQVRKDIHGKEVKTLLKWVMEAECISAFAKKHPQVKFFNCTEGGIGFAGVQNIPLAEALASATFQDLRGHIHQWIQSSPLSFKEEKFPDLIADLETSLLRCETLCNEMIPLLEKETRSGKLALLQSDLADEKVYQILLEAIDIALTRILFRYYPHIDPHEGKRACELAKFQEMKRQISMFRNIFSKHEHDVIALDPKGL